MRKWIGSLLSFFFIVAMILVFDSFNSLKQKIPEKEKSGNHRIVTLQSMEEEKKEEDSYSFLILKQLKEKVDIWLKSLNDRIESEDITRFEVRFLEILRNILEWVNEKIDGKLERLKGKKPEKKKRGGRTQETHQRVDPFFTIG